MIHASSEFKYAKCDFCGEEKECLIQHKSGKEHALCPYCLSVVYCY
jgi:hypothetical protein